MPVLSVWVPEGREAEFHADHAEFLARPPRTAPGPTVATPVPASTDDLDYEVDFWAELAPPVSEAILTELADDPGSWIGLVRLAEGDDGGQFRTFPIEDLVPVRRRR